MAAKYIAERLKSYGYQADIATFEFPTFKDLGSKILVMDEGSEIVARALIYSPPADIKTPLVFAGLGREEDYDGLDVKGKVALLGRGRITFKKKAEIAASHGAMGIIVFNNSSRPIRGASLGKPGPIPAVIISRDEGEALKERLERGPLLIHLKVDTIQEVKRSANVVARWPGAEEQSIVIGAHYDSVPEGPGANDNASGISALLTIAEEIASTPLSRRTVFVAFGAEEVGLHGSKDFVARAGLEKLKKMSAMINLDAVGVGRAIISGDDKLVNLAREIKGLDFKVSSPSGTSYTSSDHLPFHRAKVPTLFITSSPYREYHTPDDTIKIIDIPLIENVARFTIEMLGRLP